MMIRRVRSLRLLIVAALLLPAGCRRSVPQSTTATVPLKVWVILNVQGSDVFDQSGHEDNMGCRLTLEDITDYIDALKNNSHIYGPNIQFSWDGIPVPVRSPHVPFDFIVGNSDRRADIDMVMQELFQVQDEWTPGFLNIYFGGWMTFDVHSEIRIHGFTVDPAGGGFPAGHIIINDLGFDSSFQWQVLLDDHLLEHEMAHFLLRRANTGHYDPFEHVVNGSDNILDQFRPHPLKLPGAEQQESGDRIRNGTWNAP